MTIPVIILTFLIIAMFTILLILIEQGWDNINPFMVVLTLLIIISVGLGMLLNSENDIKSKKPITPSVEVKCIDGKCDTTYVYSFKDEE